MKSAIRNLARHKWYTAVNVIGLSMGIALYVFRQSGQGVLKSKPQSVLWQWPFSAAVQPNPIKPK